MVILYKDYINEEALCITEVSTAAYDKDFLDLGLFSGLIFSDFQQGSEFYFNEIIVQVDKYTAENLLKELYQYGKIDLTNYIACINPNEEDLKKYFKEEY